MKKIYFVTEGKTDRIVIEELIKKWMGNEDFLVRHIQPPTSAYVEDLDTNLSEGWKGVVSWCSGARPNGPAGRDEALRLAELLIIHTDADVAYDVEFKNPCFAPHPPENPEQQCDWVRNHLRSFFDQNALDKIAFCIPAQDLESWILAALHADVANQNAPIEHRLEPGALLVQRTPHRLIRRKDGRLKKIAEKYEEAAKKIASAWEANISSHVVDCPSAVKFESDFKALIARFG